MSSVTASRDSGKARLSRTRTTLSRDTNNTSATKRNQPPKRSPTTASANAKSKWCSTTSLSTSDTISTVNATHSSLSESSSIMEARPQQGRRMTRKAPLPAAAKRSGARGLGRRANPPTSRPDDGWEADTEEPEPFSTHVRPSRQISGKMSSTNQPPVPDEKRLEEAQRVLEECGVLDKQRTAANFAALSDADYSLSPPRLNHTHNSQQHENENSAFAPEPSMDELRDSINVLQKQVADLRAEVPQVSTNPLHDQVALNRRALEGGSAALPAAGSADASSFSVGGSSGALHQTSSAFIASGMGMSSGLQGRKGKKAPDGRARKVPLPAELMAGRTSKSWGGIAAGQSSMMGHSSMMGTGDMAEDRDDGEHSDASASSFGLSCGLPGLSNEVADTITHLSAAETIQAGLSHTLQSQSQSSTESLLQSLFFIQPSVQASVTVTPLSLKDWLLRPVPTPMDPSLTLYGAAVHNAHVACCEVVIGGLLSAIEAGAMESPSGLPSGTYDFRSRGISNEEGLQTVLRALATWIKMLVENHTGSATEAPEDTAAGAQLQDGTSRDLVSGGPILQDPRAVPLLSVLRAEALRIIGEEDSEQSVASARRRAQHLNATDMLHILTTALVPSFRQLVSRTAEDEAANHRQSLDAHAGSPDVDPLGTSMSNSSLFSVPASALPDKSGDMDEVSTKEAQLAARVAATGERPENPCDPTEYEACSVSIDHAESGAAAATTAAAAAAQDAQAAPCRSGAAAADEPLGISPLAALTIRDMRKVREGLNDEHAMEADGAEGSVRSWSPMSHTGSITPDALTDALRKLLKAGADNGTEGLDEVDVVEMLRQLAAERVSAKQLKSESNDPPSPQSSPDHASGPPDSNSNTALSSLSDVTSVHASSSKRHGEKEDTEQLQATELEKLLKNPAVIQMISQIAGGNVNGANQDPQLLQQQQQQQAAQLAAMERERAMRYEMQMAKQQQQQRMMMSTFVNMNMMQNQMANAMFSSMMTQPQPQKNVGVEKFAMLRSMANRHGVKELSNLPLKQGASAMMGQSMMTPPPVVPPLSMMPPPMSSQPRMKTPINRFASSISMPYLQVGGQTPLPQNNPMAMTSVHPPASTSSLTATDVSGSISAPVAAARSAPVLPAPQTLVPPVSQPSMSHGSLPTMPAAPVATPTHAAAAAPKPVASPADSTSHRRNSISSKDAMDAVAAAAAAAAAALPGRSASGSLRQSNSLPQPQPRASPHAGGMHTHPMQTQSMMAGHGGSMMGGVMPQQAMGMHHQKSASYMPGMGGSFMGGMGHSGSMHGMMPQQAKSFMGGSHMGGSHMAAMGMQPGMGNPYGGMSMGMGMGMPIQRSTSLPHGQTNPMQRQHSHSATSRSNSHKTAASSGSHRPRTQSHPAANKPLAQPQWPGAAPPHMPQMPGAAGHSAYHNGIGKDVPAHRGMPAHAHAHAHAGQHLERSSSGRVADRHSRSAAAAAQHKTSSTSSSRPRNSSQRASSAGFSQGFPPQSPVPSPHNASLTPPPMHGELPRSTDGSGSFMFDSGSSQQLAAAAALASSPELAPQQQQQPPQLPRQSKHPSSRGTRRHLTHLAATPEGDESTLAGESQILL